MKGEVVDGAALRMTEEDTVVTALDDLDRGQRVVVDDRSIELVEPIPFGHKFSIQHLDDGEEIVKYGSVVGRASEPIAPGTWVHVHNVESTRGRGDLRDRGGGST